ncbi:uncharacterized protein LOC135389089 [Ornithodoros turicata]|uniref:uncharacterized protein LOC135389089 n=1 Tax=Ornithodoros turicata TaxID=34597 RepID=UPI003138F592
MALQRSQGLRHESHDHPPIGTANVTKRIRGKMGCPSLLKMNLCGPWRPKRGVWPGQAGPRLKKSLSVKVSTCVLCAGSVLQHNVAQHRYMPTLPADSYQRHVRSTWTIAVVWYTDDACSMASHSDSAYCGTGDAENA